STKTNDLIQQSALMVFFRYDAGVGFLDIDRFLKCKLARVLCSHFLPVDTEVGQEDEGFMWKPSPRFCVYRQLRMTSVSGCARELGDEDPVLPCIGTRRGQDINSCGEDLLRGYLYFTMADRGFGIGLLEGQSDL